MDGQDTFSAVNVNAQKRVIAFAGRAVILLA